MHVVEDGVVVAAETVRRDEPDGVLAREHHRLDQGRLVHGRDQVVVGHRRRHRPDLLEDAELTRQPHGEVDPHRRHRMARPEVVLRQGLVEDHRRGTRARWHASDATGPGGVVAVGHHHDVAAGRRTRTTRSMAPCIRLVRPRGGPPDGGPRSSTPHPRPPTGGRFACSPVERSRDHARGQKPRSHSHGPQPLPDHPDRAPHARQPARRPARHGRRPGDRRLLLRRQRPARDDDAARPCRPPRGGRRGLDPAPRGRAGPVACHALPAEPGAGAPRAGLPAGVHGVHRRAEPDDPVQGEGPGRRVDAGLALHLPGADGRRHPALPAVVGAGGPGPAAARRAHPRPGDPLQHHLRPRVHRARGDAAAGRRAGDGPAVAVVEDVEVGRRRARA